jgi:hypothetical protein
LWRYKLIFQLVGVCSTSFDTWWQNIVSQVFLRLWNSATCSWTALSCVTADLCLPPYVSSNCRHHHLIQTFV